MSLRTLYTNRLTYAPSQNTKYECKNTRRSVGVAKDVGILGPEHEGQDGSRAAPQTVASHHQPEIGGTPSVTKNYDRKLHP